MLEGCQIVVDGPFEVLNGGRRLLSKAWDDRFGCILGVELLRSLRDVELPFDLYVGADVQEEVGPPGRPHRLQPGQPRPGHHLDCTAANDVERFEPPYGGIGQGVMVRFADGTYLPNRTMFLDYLDLLRSRNIPISSTSPRAAPTPGVSTPPAWPCPPSPPASAPATSTPAA